jgi:hypothetical protein
VGYRSQACDDRLGRPHDPPVDELEAGVALPRAGCVPSLPTDFLE